MRYTPERPQRQCLRGSATSTGAIVGREAFTLIELLVVIAILALLISILVPSLRSATVLTREVICLSNLRGVYLELALYTQEADGDLPPAESWGTDGFRTWTSTLAESVGVDLGPLKSWQEGETYRLYLCPIAERITKDEGRCIWQGSTYHYINQYTFANCGNRTHLEGWKLAMMPQAHHCSDDGIDYRRRMIAPGGGADHQDGSASRTPLLQGVTPGPFPGVNGAGGFRGWTWHNPLYYKLDHHRGGSHYLFFDGHAGWIEYRPSYRQGFGDGF